MKKRSNKTRILIYTVLSLVALSFGGGIAIVNAFGNTGVDSSDSNFSRPVGYVSARSADVTVGTSTFEIYYPNRNGNKTVNIIDGDFCRANSNGTGGKGANGIRDMGFASIPTSAASGANVTTYTFSSGGTTLATVQGKFRNSATANCDLPAVTIAGNSLENAPLDPADGRTFYKLTLTVTSGNKPLGHDYINWYRLSTNSGAYIVYGQNRQYAVDAQGKQSPDDAYYRLDIPFGTKCATGATATFAVTDPDNNNAVVQPQTWTFSIIDRSTGNAVPLTKTGGTGSLNGDRTIMTPGGGSGTTLTFTANLAANKKYVWRHWQVYDNNTIIFRINGVDPVNAILQCSNGWTLTGVTNGPTKLSAPANTYMFSHLIRNTGPDKTDPYVWKVQGGTSSSGPFTDEVCTSGAINHNAAALNNGGTAGYNCNKVIPPGTTYCQRIAWHDTSSTNTAWSYSIAKCITPPAPTTMECLDATTDPDSVDSKTRFDVDNVGGTSSGGASTATISSIRISGPGGFNQTFSNRTVTRSGSDYKTTLSNVGPTNTPGRYTVTWTIEGENCSSTFIVAEKPYLAVYGGDAITGSYEANGGCSVNRDAGFLTWNSGSPGYYGAGTQFAAMALGGIRDFASALNATTGGNPRKPTGLSFANSGSGVVDTGSGLFGGQFTDDGGGVLEDASCKFTTDVANTTALPSTVNGTKIMYVTGSDVYIDHNIIYANSGGWGSVSTIPYFKLVVVGGDIIIQNTVTQLDGLYVAEPDGSGNGGTIYTCGQSNAAIAHNNSNFYDICNHRLVINGTFAAKQVRFLRTYGTLGSATSNSSNESNAAEVFHYGPEMWLPRKPGVSLQYNSMSGLPPVL